MYGKVQETLKGLRTRTNKVKYIKIIKLETTQGEALPPDADVAESNNKNFI